MVAHIVYVVDRQEAHWTIAGCGDSGCGWFPTRKDALKSALWDAARVRRLGHDVAVLVRRRNGTVRAIPARDSVEA
jgi:hypothetical protein